MLLKVEVEVLAWMWEAIVDRVDLSFDDNIALLAFLRRLFLKISSMIVMIEVAVLALTIKEKTRKWVVQFWRQGR